MEPIHLILAGYVLLGIVLWKSVKRLHARVMMRKLQREAETEVYRAINWKRATQQAADSILRQAGEHR